MDFRNAKDISIGGKSAIEIALDGRIVWQKTQPVPIEGLCFTALEPNSTVRTVNNRIISPEISYDGKTWLPYTEGWYIPLSNVGDKVYLRSRSVTHPTSGNVTAFEMSGSIDISGNIFDLLKATDGETYTGCFKNLFRSCTKLKSTSPDLLSKMTTAPEDCCRAMFVLCSGLESGPTSLPATELGPSCYRSMFQGTAITTPPSVLPATTLADECYTSMFQDCASLTTAPELPATTIPYRCYAFMFQGCSKLTTAPELPGTNIGSYCYQYMFNGCSSLTTAPSVLPATTLATYCYQYMFNGCSSLTTAPSVLPATTLANYCYYYMFQGCSKLTTAPELPGTRLVTSCYGYMFRNCSSLSYIKVGATTWSTSYASNWVSGVSSAGTFVKPTATSITTGVSGIPSKWTVENY